MSDQMAMAAVQSTPPPAPPPQPARGDVADREKSAAVVSDDTVSDPATVRTNRVTMASDEVRSSPEDQLRDSDRPLIDVLA